MWCVLDIDRFHDLLRETGGNVYLAAQRYYDTDNAPYALRCLGIDLTSSAREARAVAGYLLSMSQRGAGADRIARFLRRYDARLRHDERCEHTGWRRYGYMRRETRLRWEPAEETRLRVV